MIPYRAILNVSRALAQYVGRLLKTERRARSTRRDSRALTCFHQAVFGLRWFRQNVDVPALARDHGRTRSLTELFCTDRLGEQTTSVKGSSSMSCIPASTAGLAATSKP